MNRSLFRVQLMQALFGNPVHGHLGVPTERRRPALTIAHRPGFALIAQEFERRMRGFYESSPRPWRTWSGCRRHGRRAR